MSLNKGFSQGVSNYEYHSDREYISSSLLKEALKDLRVFEQKRKGEEETTRSKALDIGSYIHAALLEPEELDKVAIFPGKIRRGREWDAFFQINKDRIILTQSDKESCDWLLHRVRSNKILVDGDELSVEQILSNGNAEETLCGELEGHNIKVRFDYRVGDCIIDVKTTARADVTSPAVIEEICSDFGYDLSAALYKDMADKYSGVNHNYYFMFISKVDGRTSMVEVGPCFLERGRQQYKQALKNIESLHSPQYETEVVYLP